MSTYVYLFLSNRVQNNMGNEFLERIIFLVLLIKIWVMVGVLLFTIAYYLATGMMWVWLYKTLLLRKEHFWSIEKTPTLSAVRWEKL